MVTLLKTESPGWRRECLLAVQLGLQGQHSLDQIAAATGRARSTIQTWFDTYRRGGVDALLHDARNDNTGGPGGGPATVPSCPPRRNISGVSSIARGAWA